MLAPESSGPYSFSFFFFVVKHFILALKTRLFTYFFPFKLYSNCVPTENYVKLKPCQENHLIENAATSTPCSNV